MSAIAIRATSEIEPLYFDRVLDSISSTFIDLDASRLDGEIGAAQSLICDAFNLDRSTLWQRNGSNEELVATHSWVVPGFSSDLAFNPGELPWISRKILKGEEVCFARVSQLPKEATEDKGTISRLGLKSNFTFPLRVAGQILGALSFSSLRVEQKWPESLLLRLRVIADVFANALARKSFSEALSKSREAIEEARNREHLFRTMTNSAPVLIWMSNTDQRRNFVNAGWLAFTGRAMEEEVGDVWASDVHPDDLERCREIYTTAFDARVEFEMEYRLRRSDGDYRWVIDHGVPVYETDGAFSGYVGSCIDITERRKSEQELAAVQERLLEANQRIEELKERLEHENVYPQQDIAVERTHHDIVGQSDGIRQVLKSIEQVAPTNSTVLLLGETGTGKELIARAIHRDSRRRDRTMINVNCATLPASLVENELFGREKGAYTGALTREMGRFELANSSTIFLDEVGELPLELQAKLLRVLQEGEFERLGGPRTISVDVRVIAATSRDLQKAVQEGRFREDLYYRLNVFPITIPPLRERREDIPMLTWHFLRELGSRMGRDVEAVKAATMSAFQNYPWPGNIRELKNVIERHLITNPGSVFEATLPGLIHPDASGVGTLEEAERGHISSVLKQVGWRIRGAGGAAEILGMKATTLESRMKKLGIVRKSHL